MRQPVNAAASDPIGVGSIPIVSVIAPNDGDTIIFTEENNGWEYGPGGAGGGPGSVGPTGYTGTTGYTGPTGVLSKL